MKRFYDRSDLGFALVCIGVYCAVMAPIRAALGDTSPVMLLMLAGAAAFLLTFIRKNALSERYGLVKWRGRAVDYLCFIPMLVITTTNLWGGVGMTYRGMEQVWAVLSMLLVGIVEEIIFRGFLFRALLKRNSASAAIIISSLSFGMGHLINLLTGQGGIDSLIQVILACSWGYLFSAVFYVSGSLWICMLAHGLINAFSMFSSAEGTNVMLCMTSTLAVVLLYGLYLHRKPAALSLEASCKED